MALLLQLALANLLYNRVTHPFLPIRSSLLTALFAPSSPLSDSSFREIFDGSTFEMAKNVAELAFVVCGWAFLHAIRC